MAAGLPREPIHGSPVAESFLSPWQRAVGIAELKTHAFMWEWRSTNLSTTLKRGRC